MSHSSGLVLADGDAEAASVLRIALLLIAQHGAEASAVVRRGSVQAESGGEALERQLWAWIGAAVENLLELLSPTDLLYATALAAPERAASTARAA